MHDNWTFIDRIFDQDSIKNLKNKLKKIKPIDSKLPINVRNEEFFDYYAGVMSTFTGSTARSKTAKQIRTDIVIYDSEIEPFLSEFDMKNFMGQFLSYDLPKNTLINTLYHVLDKTESCIDNIIDANSLQLADSLALQESMITELKPINSSFLSIKSRIDFQMRYYTEPLLKLSRTIHKRFCMSKILKIMEHLKDHTYSNELALKKFELEQFLDAYISTMLCDTCSLSDYITARNIFHETTTKIQHNILLRSQIYVSNYFIQFMTSDHVQDFTTDKNFIETSILSLCLGQKPLFELLFQKASALLKNLTNELLVRKIDILPEEPTERLNHSSNSIDELDERAWSDLFQETFEVSIKLLDMYSIFMESMIRFMEKDTLLKFFYTPLASNIERLIGDFVLDEMNFCLYRKCFYENVIRRYSSIILSTNNVVNGLTLEELIKGFIHEKTLSKISKTRIGDCVYDSPLIPLIKHQLEQFHLIQIKRLAEIMESETFSNKLITNRLQYMIEDILNCSNDHKLKVQSHNNLETYEHQENIIYFNGQQFTVCESIVHMIDVVHKYMYLQKTFKEIWDYIFNMSVDICTIYTKKLHEILLVHISNENSNETRYNKIGNAVGSFDFILAIMPIIHKYFMIRSKNTSVELTEKYSQLNMLIKSKIEMILNSTAREINIKIDAYLSKWFDEISVCPSVVFVRISRYYEHVNNVLSKNFSFDKVTYLLDNSLKMLINNSSNVISSKLSSTQKEANKKYIEEEFEFLFERIASIHYYESADNLYEHVKKIL